MRSKVWIFASLTLALIAYAIFDFQMESSSASKKEKAAVLFDFALDQISAIEIKTPKEDIQLSKDKEGWKILKPTEELADQGAIDSFLKEILAEKSFEGIEGEKAKDLKKFGLDIPLGRVKIGTYAGQTKALVVGSAKNYQGESYIQLSGETSVKIASANWQRTVQGAAFEYRDRRILRQPVGSMDRIEIDRIGKDSIRFERLEERWRLPDQPELLLDQNRIREFFAKLNNSPILAFAEPQDKPKNKPVLRITAHLKPDKKWLATVYPAKDDRHYVQSDDIGIHVSTNDVNSLLRMNIDGLRDRHFPFDYNRDRLTKLRYRNKEVVSEFEYKDDKWQLLNPKDGLAADDGKIKILLNRLGELLEVSQFFPGRKILPSHDQEIMLSNEKGEVVLKLEIGPREKIKEAQEFLVKSSLFAEVFSVADAKILGLELDTILVNPNAPTTGGKNEKN